MQTAPPSPKRPPQRKTLVNVLALVALLLTLALARQDGLMTWLPFSLGDVRGGSEKALTGLPLTDEEAQKAIRREADHITACSYTSASADKTSDGYGALNDDLIGANGPDWVMTEPGAVGAISLMEAAAFLHSRGEDVSSYDTALDGYFDVWLVQHKQAWVDDPHSGDRGGSAARVTYDGQGKRVKSGDATPGATGMTVTAMWKRYEYLQETGRATKAQAWLSRAWPVASGAKGYLIAHFDPNTEMERGSASSEDEWLTDAVSAADALLCLDRWEGMVGTRDPSCLATAARLKAGVVAMKQDEAWKGYYRLREHDKDNQPTNGDTVDQIGFLPYESGLLDPADPFARRISDGWTLGAGGISMTAQTRDPKNWTYYGTHWHHYTPTRLENEYLYPGPGLQLAKVEWKYGKRAHDPVVSLRAVNRLRWAVGPTYSGLWSDDGGLVDWRDAKDRGHSAEKWARFIDTSGYLIQTILMVNFGRDTTYVPSDRPATP